MYVPLDHLYHWIASLAPQAVNIYYFYPHGSKNLENVISFPKMKSQLHKKELSILPSIFCFDQEPLNFDYYEQADVTTLINNTDPRFGAHLYLDFFNTFKNINIAVNYSNTSVYDSTILVHSETNSLDVLKYQNAGYIPVHYWCHAVIAKDWFRYAQHDHRLEQKNIAKDFLIYARDWSGNREYRLKFLELIYQAQLVSDSVCYFNEVSANQKCYYMDYEFQNPKLKISSIDLAQGLTKSVVDSSASGYYDVDDIASTNISIILETQFDGSKIHLTEKICRALACGHPFVLAAGTGALAYLKHYGFKTFDPWLDESYDLETDSVQRLQKIVDTMKKFTSLESSKKTQVVNQLNLIADYNKKRFFSDEFFQQVSHELEHGLLQACELVKPTQASNWLLRRKIAKKVFQQLESSASYVRYDQRYPNLSQHLHLVRQLRRG